MYMYTHIHIHTQKYKSFSMHICVYFLQNRVTLHILFCYVTFFPLVICQKNKLI